MENWKKFSIYYLLLLLMLTDNRQTHRHTEYVLARYQACHVTYQVKISSVNLPMAADLFFSKISQRVLNSLVLFSTLWIS